MNRFRHATLAALSLTALALLQPLTARAQAAGTTRLVVPLAAGGGVDAIARKLGEKLGRPVIVDNKPGGAGTIGIDAMAKSAPDGQTVALVAGSMIVVNPHVLPKMPYDTGKDLAPVVQVGTTPLVVLVNANNPAKTLKEFIANAKARPKDATFGSYGKATVGHLLGESLNKAAGIQMVHVPYKGATPAVTDLIGGQVAAVIADFGSAKAHIGPGGKLKALAISADQRNPTFPNVPTFGEEGYPQLNAMNGWIGIFAPAKTPRPALDKLAADVARVVQSPEIKASLADLGYEATGVATDKFAAIVKQDTERWGAVVKSIGGVTLD